MRITSPKTSFVSRTLAIAALILGVSNLAAYAAPADRVTFREFRQQNDGIDRNAARRMFRQQFGRPAGNGQVHAVNPFQHVITVGPDGQAVCGGAAIDRHTRAIREPRLRNVSMQELASGALTRVNRGVDLDLGSANRNIVLGNGLFGTADGAAVEISVGGKNTTYQAGSVVTAAEYVAVKQALEGGQSIQVDRAGRASGGSVDLGSLTSGNTVMRASSLVVPENVTTYGDFGRGSDFRLSGELSNYGTVQVQSSDRAVRGGAIRANDISNHSGALISSTTDLHLDAARNLTNYGDILSTESLTLSAGGQLDNAGRVTSNGDLNINSSSVTNRGVMSSNSANVNLASSGDLAVNNNRGSISAINGAINVRDASYIGSNNSYINGGDLVSRELNLNSGLGSSNVDVNQLTGVINSTGTASHVLASTETLNVGSNCLTGDPTFYNTSGGIIISGNVIVQEDLAFIASGAISSNTNVTIQAGDANKGYNVTFISGASLTAVGGNSVPTIPVTGAPPYPNSGTVTITSRASKSGGGINFGAGTVISSRSTDTASNHNAGNISFFAFGKSSSINLGGAKVESGGQKLGTNGDVLVVAGGTSTFEAASVTISGIDTTNQLGGAQGAGGKLTISTSVPVIVNGKTVTYDDKGALVGASFLSPGTKLVKGDVNFISTNGVVNAAGAVDIKSGNIIQILNTITAPTASLFAKTMYTNSPTGKLVANALNLSTGKGGLIYGAGNGILANTGSLTINSPGGSVAVDVEGAGVLQLSSSGSTNLAITAQSREIKGGASAISNLALLGAILNPTSAVSSGNVLILSANSLTNTDVNQYSAKFLALNGNSIGINEANPFQINSSVKQVGVLSLGGTFLQANDTKGGINLAEIDSDGDFYFRSNSGVSLGVNTPTFFRSKNGQFDIGTKAGVIAINKNVNITGATGINVVNTGTTTKDKITFGTNSTLTTSGGVGGDITIGLGTKGAPVTPVFDKNNPTLNTSNLGTINFFGTGNVLSAKGLVSSINANNADVIIFNSGSSKNVTLGGNNQINASGI